MAQVEQYTGRLGFEHRSEEKLTLALTELLDTLEEFGHPALQINARDPHRIGLDSDHYKVTLRLRRMPLRLGVRVPFGLPAPAAYIELALVPNFPEACDREISEILLAMLLRRLTEALTPVVVFWQDTSKALMAKDFLSAFASEPTPPNNTPSLVPLECDADLQTVTEPDVTEPDTVSDTGTENMAPDGTPPNRSAISPRDRRIKALAARTSDLCDRATAPQGLSAAQSRLQLADQARAEAEAERARGRALFGSADAATPLLEQHCDEIQHKETGSRRSRYKRSAPRHASVLQDLPLKQAILKGVSLPQRALSATANALRGIDLVVSVRALVTAMVILFLHGSGMVQAAARVFLP